MADSLNLSTVLCAAEKECLLQALTETHGILEDTCTLMGVSQRSLYRLIHKHGLTVRRTFVASIPPPTASAPTEPKQAEGEI